MFLYLYITIDFSINNMKHIMVIYPCTLDRKGFKCKLSPSYKSCRYVIVLFRFSFIIYHENKTFADFGV